MKLLLNNEVPVHQFSSFTPDRVVIGKNRYYRSLIVTPKEIYANWPPQHIDDITATMTPITAEIAKASRTPTSTTYRGYIDAG